MLRRMRILIAIIAFGFLTAPASAQDPARHGRALVKEFCGGCHAIGRNDRSRHAGAPAFRTLGRSFDLDDFPRLLARGISSGHPDMPEFRFSDDDARDARAYLRAIQQ
jgi:mono/diheme cytochrome c family protein